jgi:quercetin dioxygenase-like cupin family protein
MRTGIRRPRTHDRFRAEQQPLIAQGFLGPWLSMNPKRGGCVEVHPGVFVSNVATEEWQADPEIGGGAEEHVLFDTGTMRAGLSRFTKDADQQPPTWVLPATQVLVVLEGEARVEIEDGPVLQLKAGDMACLPKGAATTWHLTLPFKEMWVLAG